MNTKKRIVIVGATSSIAEHCARLWVHKESVDLTLVGRDGERLERVASDLKVRSPGSVIHVMKADFIAPKAIRTVADQIAIQGAIDIVLIAHGSLPEQAMCQDDLEACGDALVINGISPVLYAEAFAKYMAAENSGTLVLISSVAGDRGRKSNYVYGSAKGLVSRYAQGLQHRFANTNVKVVLVKPGPTDTPMTAHLKEAGATLASVEDVSRNIVAAVGAGKRIVYAPGKWAIIMWVIRHLPSFVFNRLNI